MSIFKALLLSALAVTAKAAPTEVVAGRVVTHAVPPLHAFHSSPIHHAIRGVPAVHAIRRIRVPAAQAIRGVNTVSHFQSAPVFQAAPDFTAVRTLEEDNVDPSPNYSFGYSINDSVTGDSKSRQESRDGDVVSGSYSVADPDGRFRTVTYTADDVHGFQATVTYDGQPGPVASPFNTHSTSVVRTADAPTQPTVLQSVDDADTAVRSVPSIHTLLSSPAVQTFPARTAVHADHNLDNAVTAVRAFPTFSAAPAVHAFHQVHHGLSPGFAAVRTLPAVTAFHHNPAVHSLHSAAPSFIRTGNDLSRLQIVG